MNNNKNGSFKPKKVYFSQVSNNALRDNNLSLKAKGLYALIQSYITIENFILYKNTLKKNCPEGNTSFESTWKELKDKGYLLQEKHQNADGTFYYVYELLDISNHTPKTEGVDNAGNGKQGSYSNNDFNNTDSLILNIINVVLSEAKHDNNFFNHIFNYYLTEYKKHTGKYHPILSKKYIKQIVESIDKFSDEYDIYKYSDWERIIDMYFNSNLNCDRNMIHFAQEEILYNRADNCKLV